MRIFITGLLVSCAMSPALANDQSGQWFGAISKCWKIPSNATDVQPITMSVKIDQNGEVIGDPGSLYKDDTGDTRLVAESIKRAILKCAPYQTRAGAYEFEIPQTIFPKKPSAKTSLASAGVRVVDVYTFDIAGVKLGMSYEEAVSALARNFKVSESEVDDAKLSGTEKNADPEVVKWMSYSPPAGGISIIIGFSTRVPPDPLRVLSTSSINYKVTATETNRKLMEKALIEKYGRPTIFAAPGPMEWCSKPTEGPLSHCFREAQLTYYNMELSLFDLSITDAARKYHEEKNSVQPKF